MTGGNQKPNLPTALSFECSIWLPIGEGATATEALKAAHQLSEDIKASAELRGGLTVVREVRFA